MYESIQEVYKEQKKLNTKEWKQKTTPSVNENLTNLLYPSRTKGYHLCTPESIQQESLGKNSLDIDLISPLLRILFDFFPSKQSKRCIMELLSKPSYAFYQQNDHATLRKCPLLRQKKPMGCQIKRTPTTIRSLPWHNGEGYDQ